jgi:F-type H+-transporting ATPase subunit b
MICLLSQHPAARVRACETERKLGALLVFAVVFVGPSFPPTLASIHASSGGRAESLAEAGSSGVSAQPAAGEEAHGEEDHGGGWLDVVARLVNFGILAGTLVYLLRSPIRTYLTDRGAEIRSDLVNAAEMKTAAAAHIEEINRKMQALPGELEALRSQGAQETAAEEARIRAAAAAERDRLLAQARREIDLQVKVAERGLISHAADLAVGVASERIKKTITDDDQKRLVERYVQQIKP